MLISNGFKYRLRTYKKYQFKNKANKTHWRCTHSLCKATAIMHENGIAFFKGFHEHSSFYEF